MLARRAVPCRRWAPRRQASLDVEEQARQYRAFLRRVYYVQKAYARILLARGYSPAQIVDLVDRVVLEGAEPIVDVRELEDRIIFERLRDLRIAYFGLANEDTERHGSLT